jgi:hypothetical protein
MTAPACVMCGKYGGAGPLLIAELGTSRVFLHEDQEVSRVAEALARVFRPVKMNYELLGNQVPHIHWHLVPRLPTDPDLLSPIWRVDHQPAPLAPAAARERIESIRRALDGGA